MCFGNNPAEDDYGSRSSGPMSYVDNQDGVTRSGHAKEFEYLAITTGVPVRFMLLTPQGSIFKFRIFHEFNDTATTLGLQKVTAPTLVQY